MIYWMPHHNRKQRDAQMSRTCRVSSNSCTRNEYRHLVYKMNRSTRGVGRSFLKLSIRQYNCLKCAIENEWVHVRDVFTHTHTKVPVGIAVCTRVRFKLVWRLSVIKHRWYQMPSNLHTTVITSTYLSWKLLNYSSQLLCGYYTAPKCNSFFQRTGKKGRRSYMVKEAV